MTLPAVDSREPDKIFRKVDFPDPFSPTSPTTAFKVGEKTQDPVSMYYSDICTIPSNLAGDPSISVPVAVDGQGLPIGFQIMAPALGEQRLFQVAAEVERLANFEQRARFATSEVTAP